MYIYIYCADDIVWRWYRLLTREHWSHDVSVNEKHDNANAKLKVLEWSATVRTDPVVNAAEK